MSGFPLVSVVIPTYNRAHLLSRALESVRDQTYRPLEIIVVDDKSPDHTANVLEDWKKKLPGEFDFVRNQESKGGAGSRNVGITRAKGKYIAFLDDDDVWSSRKLETQIEYLEAHPECVAASCQYTSESTSRPRAVNYLSRALNRPMNEQLLWYNCFGSCSFVVVRAESLSKIGGFDGALKAGQDWDLWIRLAPLGDLAVIDESLCLFNDLDHSRITGRSRNYIHSYKVVVDKHHDKMSSECLDYHAAYIQWVLAGSSNDVVTRAKHLLKLLRFINKPTLKMFLHRKLGA